MWMHVRSGLIGTAEGGCDAPGSEVQNSNSWTFLEAWASLLPLAQQRLGIGISCFRSPSERWDGDHTRIWCLCGSFHKLLGFLCICKNQEWPSVSEGVRNSWYISGAPGTIYGAAEEDKKKPNARHWEYSQVQQEHYSFSPLSDACVPRKSRSSGNCR